MNEVIVVAISGIASFIGSYMALKVHVQYLRRDIDIAVTRINELANNIDFIERNYRKVSNHV